MQRREFITLLGGAAAAWPRVAHGQQPAERMRRIGILADERWPPIDSLKQGLRNLGYVEGQNLGRVDVALGTPASVAAKRATEGTSRARPFKM
jgi:putative ABC transport system substrate-binding protein